MLPLTNRVALVTGASRGAGRAIAAVLGERGATVYVTGRSVRGKPTTDNLPGTIHDTAEEVARRGGVGIPIRCDHTSESQTKALFRKIEAEQGHLDILVNNAWGGYEGERPRPAYFWQTPLRYWDAMLERGLKAHMLATHFAIPLMIANKRRSPGLIVSTVAWDRDRYLGGFYDLSKNATVRFLWGLAMELREYRVATVALAPGFMRTERVMAYAPKDKDWKEVPWLSQTESPEYLGRAVAALAGDQQIMRRSGKAFHVGELAKQYGFTDVDGRRVPPFYIREPFLKTVKKLNSSGGGR